MRPTDSSVDYSLGLEVINGDMPGILDGVGEDMARVSGSTVLVTGAAGMLPSYIADTLAYLNDEGVLSQQARLKLLVRRPPTPDSRLGHLVGRPDVEFIVQDVAAPLELGGPIDFVVHAVAFLD